MALDVLRECQLTGPAFSEPFVRYELEKELLRLALLPKTTGDAGESLQKSWESYRRKLRELVMRGGAFRVSNHVIEPLVLRLGYHHIEPSGEVKTREGNEPGGNSLLWVAQNQSCKLRFWCVNLDEDLDAPARRGSAYRYSHVRIAQRVLLASGERLGLLTNGVELRLLISDPARPDSQIIIKIDPDWKRSREAPDSYRLLVALASPAGVKAIPELVEKARLLQTRVTKDLRKQAREAVELFVQEVLDRPENQGQLKAIEDKSALARSL